MARDYKKLRTSIQAGQRGINTNKKCDGSTYCIDIFNEQGRYAEISYYQAQIILLLFADCITDDGIDLDNFFAKLENIDSYELRAGGN